MFLSCQGWKSVSGEGITKMFLCLHIFEVMFKPYRNGALNRIYNLLFCDDVNLFRDSRKAQDAGVDLWQLLFNPLTSAADLEKVVSDHALESRMRLLAASRLRGMNVKAELKELLGVVIEVGLEDGLDTLAGYNDQTARYINFSEKMVVWEAGDSSARPLFARLMDEGSNVVSRIGAWDKARLPFPQAGTTRITFLVTDGLYFGQGSTNILFKDPMAAPVLNAGLELMRFLTTSGLTGQ
jgi:hypothetical protein